MRIFAKIWLLCSLCLYTFADTSKLLDCSIIFEARKDEIKAQLDEIDERQQALQVLQNATQVILDEKERQLLKKEEEINQKILLFSQEQEKVKEQEEQTHKRNLAEIEEKNQEIDKRLPIMKKFSRRLKRKKIAKLSKHTKV